MREAEAHASDALDDARRIGDRVLARVVPALGILARVADARAGENGGSLEQAAGELERLTGEQLATRLPVVDARAVTEPAALTSAEHCKPPPLPASMPKRLNKRPPWARSPAHGEKIRKPLVRRIIGACTGFRESRELHDSESILDTPDEAFKGLLTPLQLARLRQAILADIQESTLIWLTARGHETLRRDREVLSVGPADPRYGPVAG